jgi:1-acyl-sn-glycerol-3-phosphate acyltransferase
MLARARLALACLVFALYSVPAAAHLYGGWILRVLARVPAPRRRRFAAEWRAWWGDASFAAVSAALGLRVTLRIPKEVFAEPEMPVVVVANHRKTLDILVLTALVRRLGRPPVEWVMKKQLRHRAAFLGHSCIMSGSAFVGRDGNVSDLLAVARAAAKARESGSGIVIFPEGTRFSERKRKDGFARVLPPRQGGFDMIRASLPTYPVLSVTIDWQDRGGATALASHSLAGATVVVTCVLHAPEDAARPGWLDVEWRRKDDELRSA